MANSLIIRSSLLILLIVSISIISLISTSFEQQFHEITTTNPNGTHSTKVGVIDNGNLAENTTKSVIPQPDLDLKVLTTWYHLHLNSEKIEVNMTVTNHLNSTHTYYLIEKATSPTYIHPSSDSITVGPNSNNTVTFTQQFDVGQWNLLVQVQNAYNGTIVNQKNVVFVVEPVQDYLILLGVIVSAIIGILTFVALIYSVLYSSRQVKTSALFKVFELLSTPDVRKARTNIHKEFRLQKKLGNKEIKFRNTTELPNLEEEVDLVLSSFDQASVIVINKLLDEDSFFDAYGEMIVREWKTLQTEILERQNNNPLTLKHFTQLKKRFEIRKDIGNTEPYYDKEEEPNAD